MSESNHIFSEKDVAEIIQRAAVLQEESSEVDSHYTPGVTREELERVAQEVGVSPAFLDRAIRERLVGAEPRKFAGVFQEEERVIEGEIDPENFDVILDKIRVFSSRRHQVQQIGRTLRAQAATGSGLAKVEMTSRNGRTRVSVKPFPFPEIMATFYPAFILSVTLGGALAERGLGGTALAIGAGAFAAAAGIFTVWIRKSKQNVKKLADKLEAAVKEEVSRNPGTSTREATEPNEEDLKVRLEQGDLKQ